MSEIICYKWNNADVKWKDANFTWKEACLVIEIIKSIGGPNTNIVKVYRSLPKRKKRDLITLITKISSLDDDYANYRSELTKEKLPMVKVTVKDVEMLAKAVLGTKIEITDVNYEKLKKS